MEDKYSSIKVSTVDDIFIIALNRPEKKNAINLEIQSELISAFAEAAQNDDVKITVLTGEGDYYSSGIDLQATNIENPLNGISLTKKLVRSFIDFPKILVALVNGPAVGLAVTTLGLCDAVYAVENATFWTPFSSLGLCSEACASFTFPRLIGNFKATEMLCFGKKITAREAERCGLITEVYKIDDMDQKLEILKDFSRRLCKESLLSYKRLYRKWESELLYKVNDAEINELVIRMQSPEVKKTFRTFKNKSERPK